MITCQLEYCIRKRHETSGEQRVNAGMESEWAGRKERELKL